MGVSSRREHDFQNLYEQEREASYRGSVFFRLGIKGELGRESEKTRREAKEQNNNALPDSFLYESLVAR